MNVDEEIKRLSKAHKGVILICVLVWLHTIQTTNSGANREVLLSFDLKMSLFQSDHYLDKF